MAERKHLRCTACGSLRTLDAFGINGDGEFEGLREHETAAMVQSFNGKNGIRWREGPISIREGRAQLACYEAAAERQRAELEDVEE